MIGKEIFIGGKYITIYNFYEGREDYLEEELSDIDDLIRLYQSSISDEAFDLNYWKLDELIAKKKLLIDSMKGEI